MSIRRQTILASIVIYIGFAVGLLNVYFFTREEPFTPTQYGLTGIFFAIATMMLAFANLAMPSYIHKFYHYYNDHLPPRKNDMITWALVVSTIGFLFVIIAGWAFKNLVIRKFGENSPELLQYYYWIFPMGLGLTIFSILEAYTWHIGKPVLTNFLKEVQWRLLVTVLIVLLWVRIIPDFDLFIKLYSLTHLAIAATLFIYLIAKKKIHFTFTMSKVTRRFRKKIITLCAFVFTGSVISTLSQVFDTIVIASLDGLDSAGVFTLASLLTSIIHAPQRGIEAASIPHLSRAWKDKNIALIQKIYQRSSINLLIFASAIYALIALNYTNAIATLEINSKYLLGFNAFLLLGLTRVIDLGTGVNSQIIGTSNYWRFQLVSGVILLSLMLPLTYVLTKNYGILGPAIANFVSITIYNLIRIIFLYRKFRLFPFTIKSMQAVILAAVAGLICYYLFRDMTGFAGLIIRSIAFIALFVTPVLMLRLSPDTTPVLESLGKRLRIRK